MSHPDQTDEDVVEKLMEEIDTDLDGYISFNEFITASIDKRALLN
jgi:Ca2+-binding EF-hand superfamily protein